MRIGIDLGGTKTEIICLHADNGKELYRHRIPSTKGDYKKTIKSLVNLVHQAEETLGQKGTIGIGIPGALSSKTGLVKGSENTSVNGQPLQRDLEEVLKRTVKIENDANCFAVSEATDGAAAGKHVVFGVIIGTGCGAGIAIDGKPVTGINSIAGEWGHASLPMPRIVAKNAAQYLDHFDQGKNMDSLIDPVYCENGKPDFFEKDWAWNEYPGPQCYCGRRGCLETWLSGTGFKADYQRVYKEDLSTHDIVAAAQKGEEKASAALARYCDRLARALGDIINTLDPDVIVLGGGMSNVDHLYDEVPKLWKRYVFSDTIDTKLLPPRFGDSSGVRGAAWLNI